MNNSEKRPWGSFEVILESETYKVKRIIVNPNCRISLQYHLYRTEVWVIVSGKGIITQDNTEILCQKGTYIEIAPKMIHRIENNGNDELVFIEVQNGEYLGEDDIIRLKDDFGRIQ